jgi:hypothetical protein
MSTIVIGMESMIVARGNGYAGDTSFDGFTVLAEPLPTRESRVFKGENGRPGVTYASHSLKLAKREGRFSERGLFILLEHGGGRAVISFSPCYDNGAALAALLALPEAILYSILYGIAKGVEQADLVARSETAQVWSQAFCDGRIRKSRAKQGRRTVTIDPEKKALDASELID